jgi:L-alanine-DL-glutamate epimerase-like enolase superfamily enzyme
MRIASIDTWANEWVAFVRVRSDDGDEGWGQTAPYNADITARVLHRQVAPHLIGTAIDEFDGLGTALLEAEHKFPGSYVYRAFGGVDTAVWDLRARRAGMPVCELAGGVGRPLRVYASSMRRDIDPTDEAARLAEFRSRLGVDAFKVRVGREVGHDRDEWPGRSRALIPEMRRVLGDDAALLVDGNSCYSPARAIELGRFLEQQGFCHFEEPCPYWQIEQTAEVRAALDIDVAGGEQDCFLWQWRRIVGLPSVDIVQPDVCYVGGFTRALAVAEMANEAGLRCVPHSANLSLVTPFAQHLMCAIPNAGQYVEYSIEGREYYPWQYDLYKPLPIVDNGTLAAPSGPGWGVEINPRWLADAERLTTTLPARNPLQ